MNKEEEIEKILSRLERIDHKEYSCGFEFADSSSFDEVERCFYERKKFANYVKELQQENKELKEEYVMLQNASDSVEEELQQRIGKAITYINMCLSTEDIDGYTSYDLSKEEVEYLLEILKGDSNE